MKLRIVGSQEADDCKVDVHLEDDNKKELQTFSVEDYNTPYTKNYRNTLAWYFAEYPLEITKALDELNDKGVVEKVIRFGQTMGDELLGEDHQLYKVVQTIEAFGYANVEVSIESQQIGFLDDLWESMVLPESKFILSAVCKEFSRKIGLDKTDIELSFDLGVTPPIAEQIAQMNQQEGESEGANVDRSNDRPLNILHLVGINDASDNHATYTSFIDKFCAEGAIRYHILPIDSLNQLAQFLQKSQFKYHIVQLGGEFTQTDGEFYLSSTQSSNASGLGLSQIMALLVLNKVPLLCVDARGYIGENKENCVARVALAQIAKLAQQQKLYNVIGLGEIVDPWISSQCFNALYTQLAKGFMLGQAVVEARKYLQSQVNINRFTSAGKPFHFWSLLQHFSAQTIEFFVAAQAQANIEESQFLVNTRKKLLGFPARYITAPFFNIADQGFVSMLGSWEAANNIIALIGARGSGKTHVLSQLGLYLAANDKVDYVFYFDYHSDFYDQAVMEEMIAPVLGFDSVHKDKTIEALKSCRCLFVLDGILNVDKTANSTEEQSQFLAFMSWLTENGHTVVASGCTVDTPFLPYATPVTLAPMSKLQRQIFGAEYLRRNNLVGKDTEDEWTLLLESTDGNPFLLQHLIPLLQTMGAGEVARLVSEEILPMDNSNVVDSFYCWQWRQQSTASTKLLSLCASVEGLVLELIMIAVEQKEGFEPAKQLFKALGDESLKVSDMLTEWENRGFISTLPYGRIINSRAKTFLTSSIDNLFDRQQIEALQDDEVQLCFSQVMCEGIRMLSNHIVRQQNQALLHNQLMNRRHWVSHFERLWFAGKFRDFIAVKVSFEQLLQQVGLMAEMAEWSLDLLGRSDPINIKDEVTTEIKLAWLLMAITALGSKKAVSAAVIKDGADKWQVWLNTDQQSNTNIDRSIVALTNHCIVFLETYYQIQENWDSCVAIVTKAYEFYTQHQAWPRVVTALKSLAAYSVKLGALEQAIEYERRILEDIPFEHSPPGFEIQQLAGIAYSRISRKDPDNAQIIVDQISQHKDAANIGETINGLQADIFYLKEDFSAALSCYCKLWERAIGMQQLAHIEQLQKQFTDLKEKIGAQAFEEIFMEHTAEDTPLPDEYTVN